MLQQTNQANVIFFEKSGIFAIICYEIVVVDFLLGEEIEFVSLPSNESGVLLLSVI